MELISEYYAFRNRAQDGGAHGSHAGFLQVGRMMGVWTPFARFEMARLNQSDSYFAQLLYGQSYRRSGLGLRYDINPRTALKFEALHTRLTDRQPEAFPELRAQWAVRF